MDNATGTPTRTRLHALLAVILIACLVACGSFIPRQGWNPSYGPVVPHDTFPADCSLCHTGKNWSTIKPDFTFDHEKETGVPLNGSHAKVACLLCHNDRGPVKQFSAQGCAGCHTDPHTGQLGRSCADCHNEGTWTPLDAIARHTRTRFPLVGSHAAVACFRCHPGAQVNNFVGADTACISCHQSDLARAVSPNHAAQGWVTDCRRCHNSISWRPAKFNHPASFPLTGGHAGHDCTRCHQGGVYTGLSTACASCHMPDYQATTNPNHAASNFSTSCNQCHNTNTWLGATFNHPASFPLTGGHAGRSCTACHQGGVYTGLSTSCVTCHMPQYTATTNPNHAAAGFPTTCNQCHTTITWQGASFNHPASFPLTGGHAGRTCGQCHTGGVYTGLSTACASCHMPRYQATTNPNHAAAGFPTTCNQCHSTITWQGASFSHPPSFPLTAGHAGRTCSQCHTGGVFTGLSTACASCHMARYQATTNPNHAVAGFSTVCTACHNTTSWLGATFNHAFPITSGPHRVACNQCHLNAATYVSFSCTHCHAHESATMASHHSGVPGYAWVSQSCYQCHPTP